MSAETSTSLAFTKMHGAGNDYVYIDGRGPNAGLDWPTLTVAISDRHFGVGSDGVIVALESETADLRMQMFNADGSEGKMCGNGIRCLTAFAVDIGMVPSDRTPVAVETASGVLSVTPIWRDDRMVRARVDMGEPQFAASEVPFNVPGQPKLDDYPIQVAESNFAVTGVSMGNPHAVAVVDEPVADIELARLGPLVEHDARFPEGVNFGVVNVVSPNEVNLRVWERGSGLTMACGTGACAAVVATRLKGLTGDAVTVNLPGGQLDIEWSGRGSVTMEGPIQKVFEGEWPL
jgi:diaminopimelate epimerase